MKRILLTVLVWILPVVTLTAQTAGGSTFRISLLTCSSGTDIASAYGHSAIRVTDPVSGADMVFNYGSYNFEEPHFVYKFMRGRLDYMLAVSSFEAFMNAYRRENRSVDECVLNLTPEQEVAVYIFLVNNYQGRNRFYRYDYFSDNCATRIRDILIGSESVTGGILPEGQTSIYTYRTAIGSLCIGDEKWLQFGLDILLGARIDKPLSVEEEMFLPSLLEKHLLESKDMASGNGILLGKERILACQPVGSTRAERFLKSLTSPVAVFSALCLAFCLLIVFSASRDKVAVRFSRAVSLLVGLAGALVLFMWLGTDHYWTKENWNLLWADPLFLVPAVIRRGRIREISLCVLSAIALVPLPLWGVIPQQLNPAVLPLVALMVLVCAAVMLCGTERVVDSKYKTVSKIRKR